MLTHLLVNKAAVYLIRLYNTQEISVDHTGCSLLVHFYSMKCSSAGEVSVHGNNVVIKSCILGVTGTGQFELLCGMRQLESSVWVGRVWQHGALSLQQISHSLQQLPETESQGSLPKTVQLLTSCNKNQ